MNLKKTAQRVSPTEKNANLNKALHLVAEPPPSPSKTISRVLTPEEAERFGEALDAIRDDVLSDLGQADVDHIRGVIRACRYSEVGGRFLLHFGLDPITFIVGTGLLSLSKIIENMEIGHNVMHGQYDWTNDPDLNGATYEWDHSCTGDDWREYHNFEHHTFTNVLNKDRDIGYAFLRVCPEQPWHPVYLVQTLSAALLALGFEWGVGGHGLHLEEVWQGKQSLRALAQRARPFLKKTGWQLLKDYGFFPALAGFNGPRVAAGNLLANLTRNLWTFSVIFCGHFPEGVRVYTEEETQNESRGQWYARQIGGSANIEGSPWFHVLTGHLSHQIEHHLYPDLPGARYPQIAEKVRAVCERHGQLYNTGSFGQQLRSVLHKIVKHSLPSTSVTRTLRRPPLKTPMR